MHPARAMSQLNRVHCSIEPPKWSLFFTVAAQSNTGIIPAPAPQSPGCKSMNCLSLPALRCGANDKRIAVPLTLKCVSPSNKLPLITAPRHLMTAVYRRSPPHIQYPSHHLQTPHHVTALSTVHESLSSLTCRRPAAASPVRRRPSRTMVPSPPLCCSFWT